MVSLRHSIRSFIHYNSQFQVLICFKFQDVFNLENIYTLTKTHNHSDWGCLYKAGDLSLIKLVAYHYFIKGIQDSLESDNENKCAIHFISHALVCDILCRTLECVI